MLFDYINLTYYVQDLLKIDGTNYLVALNYNDPKQTDIFAYKFLGNVFMVRKIEEKQIIKNVLFNSLKKEVA